MSTTNKKSPNELPLTKRQFISLIRGMPNTRHGRSIKNIIDLMAERTGTAPCSRPLITKILKSWEITPKDVGVFENPIAFLDHDSKMASASLAGRDTNIVALEQINSVIVALCLKAEAVINNLHIEDLEMKDAFLLYEVAQKGMESSNENRNTLVDTVRMADVRAPAPKQAQGAENVVTDFSTFLDAAKNVSNGKSKNGK